MSNGRNHAYRFRASQASAPCHIDMSSGLGSSAISNDVHRQTDTLATMAEMGYDVRSQSVPVKPVIRRDEGIAHQD